MYDEKTLAEIVSLLHTDRWKAHNFLFKRRHKKASAWFHKQLVEDLAAPHSRGGNELFRGAAKTTYAEESIIVMGLHREINYGIIIGETYEKAVQRLASIKYELETNDSIRSIYGKQMGRSWRENAIELSNGTLLQAFGRGQNIRGEKNPYNNNRPDYVLLEDVEDADSVRTEDAIEAVMRWLNHEVLPALEDYNCRVRINGTRLHPRCMLAQLSETPGWREHWHRIPMWFATDGSDIDPDNPCLVSNWPDKHGVDEAIRPIIRSFLRSHDINGLCQEYLCRSHEDSMKYFPRDQITVGNAADIPVWAPRYVIIDPARKGKEIRKGNARTGYLAAATQGRKMLVQEAHGRYDTPEDIVKHAFELNERHHPVWIGVEADGLEEFLWAPFRAEMQRRGVTLPLRALYAPKAENKEAFILGLQPFYKSGEVVMCGHKDGEGVIQVDACQDLVTEMDHFPTGTNDVLNCLAYLPQLRGGDPIYADFGPQHVMPGDRPEFPVLAHYLLFHGDATAVSAVVAALGRNGEVAVLEDYLLQPTSEAVLPVLAAARAYPRLRVAATPPLFKPTGGPLVHILKRSNNPPLMAGAPETGALTVPLRSLLHNAPAFQVSPSATWALRALAGGYCRNVDASGQAFENPAEGTYRLVGECLEALTALMSHAQGEDDSDIMTTYTRGGVPYLSTLRRS